MVSLFSAGAGGSSLSFSRLHCIDSLHRLYASAQAPSLMDSRVQVSFLVDGEPRYCLMTGNGMSSTTAIHVLAPVTSMSQLPHPIRRAPPPHPCPGARSQCYSLTGDRNSISSLCACSLYRVSSNSLVANSPSLTCWVGCLLFVLLYSVCVCFLSR